MKVMHYHHCVCCGAPLRYATSTRLCESCHDASHQQRLSPVPQPRRSIEEVQR